MSPYRQPAFVPPPEVAKPKARRGRALPRAIGIALTLCALPTCELGLENDTRLWLLGPCLGLVGLVLVAQNNIARDG